MTSREITYIIVGLIIMLVMHVIETINCEESHTYYENAAQLVGGVAGFALKVLVWPMIVVNEILIKI